MNEAVERRDGNKLGCFQRFGHGHGDVIGVHPIRPPVAVKTQRRDDRHDALHEQRLEHLRIDAFDLAGELVIDTVKDAERMRGDSVGADGAEIVRGKPFENFVCQAVGGGEREFERLAVGDAGAVEIGGLDLLLLGQRLDLRRRPVNDDHADAQRTEHGDIEQDVGKIFVGDDRAVDAENEGLFAEARDILQDAAKVSRFHVSFLITYTHFINAK